MLVVFFYRLFWMVLLLLLQVLIFNHVHFMDYATPLVYVYFLLLFPVGISRHAALLWSFLLGLCIDMFSNTPGVSAATTTLMGLVQPALLNRIVPKDCVEGTIPTFSELGSWVYVRYVMLVVALHHAVFFLLETFSLAHYIELLINWAASWVLTVALCLALEQLRSRK